MTKLQLFYSRNWLHSLLNQCYISWNVYCMRTEVDDFNKHLSESESELSLSKHKLFSRVLAGGRWIWISKDVSVISILTNGFSSFNYLLIRCSSLICSHQFYGQAHLEKLFTPENQSILIKLELLFSNLHKSQVKLQYQIRCNGKHNDICELACMD